MLFVFQTCFFLISENNCHIIAPLAVIPLQQECISEISSLQQFADASNSNLIYAQDEFGNNLAVGVFVTEQFDEHFTGEKYSTEHGQEGEQVGWVGAMEECITASDQFPADNNETELKKSANIKVYKVKKSRKSRAKPKSQSNDGPKMLKELKQFKSNGTKKCLQIQSSKNCRIERNLKISKSTKPVWKVRKNYDKSYRPSCRVQWYKLTHKHNQLFLGCGGQGGLDILSVYINCRFLAFDAYYC